MSNMMQQSNPNSSWVNSKGTWVTNILIICAIKILFSAIPYISREASWTLTNVAYNLGSFIMFHWIIGSPFATNEDEDYQMLTLWEQLDDGVQFTPTKKFLTVTPIVLFLMSVHYTHYDLATFLINFMALMISLIGKLPIMDRVRIFGINKKNL
jgi:hypothetical protein